MNNVLMERMRGRLWVHVWHRVLTRVGECVDNRVWVRVRGRVRTRSLEEMNE